jgi:YbbR domain-containing protein
VDAGGKKVDKALAFPANVEVRIEIQPDSVTETKAAGAAVTGQPAQGCYISNVQVNPALVSATGLVDVLGALKQIASDPVDISNQCSDVVRTVTLRPPAGVTVSPRTVQVHVFIAKNPVAGPSSPPP